MTASSPSSLSWRSCATPLTMTASSPSSLSWRRCALLRSKRFTLSLSSEYKKPPIFHHILGDRKKDFKINFCKKKPLSSDLVKPSQVYCHSTPSHVIKHVHQLMTKPSACKYTILS